MFINSTEELSRKEVDDVVEMELGESLEESVKRAVKGCVAVMGLEMPSDEKIQEGLDKVTGYAAVKKPDDPNHKKKLDARYYGLLPEVDLKELVDRAFANESQSNKEFLTQLETDKRITKRPHVTIVHSKAIDKDSERDLWDRCTGLHELSTAPLFKCTLRNLVWDGRVMAITVDDFDVVESAEAASSAGGSKDNELAREFVSNLSDETRSRLHITVGTLGDDIKAVEAKTMVEKWRRGEELDKIKSIKLVDQVVYGRIKGLMN
jgi:tRNA ligase